MSNLKHLKASAIENCKLFLSKEEDGRRWTVVIASDVAVKKMFWDNKNVLSPLDLIETVSSNIGLKGSNLKFIKLIGKLTHHGLPSYNHNRNNYNRNTI